MRRIPLLIILLFAFVSLAAAAESNRASSQWGANLPIGNMSTDFLYLAASQAMQDGNSSLAIGFLKALSDKDPEAALPRLQLAQLLLEQNRADEARGPVQELLAMPELPAGMKDNARMQQVQILVLDGKKDQAITTLQALLRQSPDSYPARLILVRLLTVEKRFGDAHQVIRMGLKDKQHPQLYHIQAQLFIRQGKLGEAEKALKSLIKYEPNESGPVLMLSQLALRQHKPVKAENVLRHHLIGHPEALSVSNALGRLLVEQQRGDEAIAVYKDIAKRTGENADVMIALGLLYFQQQNFEPAARTFRKVLDQGKDSRAAYYLAASLDALGQKKEARKLYGNIGKDDDNFSDAQLRIAAMDLRNGRVDVAISSLRKMIKRSPEMANAYSLLSAALMRKKAYRKLLDETERALGLSQVPVQLLFNRAAAFEGLKQYPQAATQIKKLFTIEPGNIEALNFLGYLYAEQGIRLDEAEKLIRRALEQRPDNGYYLDSLAWVHYQRAEYDKALDVQRKAVDSVPDDPVMREHLGDILWKNGKADAARSAWKDAINRGHENRLDMQKKISKGM
ncbi:MAG: tetratricopeptide repeat protein [Mariprofundaceae bacterium]|nr:tetratricopeptide repeat protein [Mariprofundaceae bacterium]